MGDKVSIKLQKRELRGKKVERLRRQGITPVIVYGANIEPIVAQADSLALARVYSEASLHTPVELEIDGQTRLTMIKSVDIDRVKRNLRHVAFHAIKQNQAVETEVAIRLIGLGDSEAEKAGLVVLQALDRVEIKALPKNLPDAIEVDVSGLAEVGDRVTLGDAKLPSGVEYIERDSGRIEEDDVEKPRITDLMVASVYEPAALQAANEAAAGAAEENVPEAEPSEETTEVPEADQSKNE
jgi:large subunit ribosomal protein L25